jgi:hypothetical protein
MFHVLILKAMITTPVTIIPNKDSGELLTPYESNNDFGYLHLQQETITMEGGWAREQMRSTLLRSRVETLERILKAFPKGTMPGRLCVVEIREDQATDAELKRFMGADYAEHYDERVEQYVKRAGNDGPELTLENARILRFTYHDMGGQDADRLLRHDNGEEVTAWKTATGGSAQRGTSAKAVQPAASASLPG